MANSDKELLERKILQLTADIDAIRQLLIDLDEIEIKDELVDAGIIREDQTVFDVPTNRIPDAIKLVDQIKDKNCLFNFNEEHFKWKLGDLLYRNGFKYAQNLAFLFNSNPYITSVHPTVTYQYSSNEAKQEYTFNQTGQAYSLSQMYENCPNLVLGGKIDVSNTYRANGMFKDCKNLEWPEFAHIELKSKIIEHEDGTKETVIGKYFNNMFQGCEKLIYTPVSGHGSTYDANYQAMFKNCIALTRIDDLFTPSGKETDYYEDSKVNMIQMFSGCEALIYVPKNWNLDCATDLGQMFQGCTSLQDLSLTSKNATNIDRIVAGCTNLKTFSIHAPELKNLTTTTFSETGSTSPITELNLSTPNCAINWSSLNTQCPNITDLTIDVLHQGYVGNSLGNTILPNLETLNINLSSQNNNLTQLVSSRKQSLLSNININFPLKSSIKANFSNSFSGIYYKNNSPTQTTINLTNDGYMQFINGASMFSGSTGVTNITGLDKRIFFTDSSYAFTYCQYLKKLAISDMRYCENCTNMFKMSTLGSTSTAADWSQLQNLTINNDTDISLGASNPDKYNEIVGTPMWKCKIATSDANNEIDFSACHFKYAQPLQAMAEAMANYIHCYEFLKNDISDSEIISYIKLPPNMISHLTTLNAIDAANVLYTKEVEYGDRKSTIKIKVKS